MLVKLFHLFGIHDGSCHLDVQRLYVADQVMDAAGHHQVGRCHIEHRIRHHRRVTEYLRRNAHRLHRFLSRLDVIVAVLSTFFALVPVVSLAYTRLRLHVLRGLIGLSL